MLGSGVRLSRFGLAVVTAPVGWTQRGVWKSQVGLGLEGTGLFWPGVELVEDVFEVVEFLAGFGEFAGGGEALVVGEVLAGLRR